MTTTKEIFDALKIGKIAENIDLNDFSLQAIAEMSIEQLQSSFQLDRDSAKKVKSAFDQYRTTPEPSISLLEMLLNKLKPNRSKVFSSKFSKSARAKILHKPGDEWDMDYVTASYSASSQFFQEYLENMAAQIGDPNSMKNSRGWTSLMCAAAMGRDNIIQLMLDANDSSFLIQNDEGQSALMFAASFGNANIIKTLFTGFQRHVRLYPGQLASSPRVILDQQDKKGFSALHYSAYYGQNDAVQCLCEMGADPNLPDSIGMTPTMYACEDVMQEASLTILLQHGGNMKQKNAEGKSGNDIVGSDRAKILAPDANERREF